MIRLTYEGHFDSAHHLPNYIGKCSNIHGHRWGIVIVFEGEPKIQTGMVIDFTEIKMILSKFDHQDLNNFIKNPTAENIAKAIYEEFIGYPIQYVEILESPNTKVRYYEPNL